MTEVGGASPGPALTPVAAPGRGPSAWVALGLITAALVALVGISLVGQSSGPGPQAAVGGSTATPVATPSPTAPPTPPPGTPPPRVAVSVGPVPTCPPGSTPDKPGPVAQPRPPQNIPAPMAFDRHAGRIVLPGGVETWTFDVCTNTWTRMQQPNRIPDDMVVWSQIIYDVDSDVTIASAGSEAWAYDLEANTWTLKDVAPYARLRFYDPVSGLVVATGDDRYPDTPPSELLNYDVETDTWTPIHQANRPAEPQGFGMFAYDASVDRIIAYNNVGGAAGAKTWLFDIRTGTWSGTGAVTPEFGSGMGLGPSIAYDEATKRTVISGFGRLTAYDATADRWEILVEADPDRPWLAAGPVPSSHWVSIVYDPVNERLVGRGLYEKSGPDGTSTWFDDVVAFDLATREWTVLLEPGDGQPAPS